MRRAMIAAVVFGAITMVAVPAFADEPSAAPAPVAEEPNVGALPETWLSQIFQSHLTKRYAIPRRRVDAILVAIQKHPKATDEFRDADVDDLRAAVEVGVRAGFKQVENNKRNPIAASPGQAAAVAVCGELGLEYSDLEQVEAAPPGE